MAYIEQNVIETSSHPFSIQHLVDWSAAMLPQIHKLGANYTEWVNKPVDRPLRLFRHDSIEMLTKTPWWLLPAFWLPCIGWLLNHSIQSQPSAAVGVHLLAGLILWTIVEYTLHRWVFHMDTVGASTTLCTVHFVMHGLHHKVPFDPYRLVFPPVPAVLIASVFYQPMRWLSHCPEVLLAGGLAGKSNERTSLSYKAETMRFRSYPRLPVLRHDPLLHPLRQSGGERLHVQHETLPLSASFRAAWQRLRHQQPNVGRCVRHAHLAA